MSSEAHNAPREATHIGTHIGASVQACLDTVCERCPRWVGWWQRLFLYLLSDDSDAQDVKEMNSHHTVLSSTEGERATPNISMPLSKAAVPLGHQSERSCETHECVCKR